MEYDAKIENIEGSEILVTLQRHDNRHSFQEDKEYEKFQSNLTEVATLNIKRLKLLIEKKE